MKDDELDFVKKKMKFTKIVELEAEIEELKSSFYRYKQLKQSFIQRNIEEGSGFNTNIPERKMQRVMSAQQKF